MANDVELLSYVDWLSVFFLLIYRVSVCVIEMSPLFTYKYFLSLCELSFHSLMELFDKSVTEFYLVKFIIFFFFCVLCSFAYSKVMKTFFGVF